MAFIPVKVYAKADLLAGLLQQRHVPAELCSYPLTPMQIPGHSHCPIPSPELRFLQPFASTENKNPQTEIFWEITFQMKFVGFIMEEHVHACTLCGRGEEHKTTITRLMITESSQGCLYRMDELSVLPQPFATLSLSSCPNQRHTSVKYHVTPLKPNLYISAQRLTILWEIMQNVMTENL